MAGVVVLLTVIGAMAKHTVLVFIKFKLTLFQVAVKEPKVVGVPLNV